MVKFEYAVLCMPLDRLIDDATFSIVLPNVVN